MRDKLKNIVLALLFVIFIVGFAVIIYNTFIRKEPEKPKTDLTTIDRTDKDYSESNDPYSESYIPEKEIDEDLVGTNNSYYTNKVINYKIDNTEISFGIDSNSSIPGIVLNPSISGDKQYIAVIQADHGNVTINEENQKYLMEDFDSDVYIKSMKGWIASNARYIDDENYGCYYSVYLDDLIDTDYIRVRFLNKDNLNLEYMLNLRIDNIGDKYSITEVSNGNIYNYDEHNYMIENAIKDSGTKYFNSDTDWVVTSTLLGDASDFYDIKLSEGKYDRIKSIADISNSDKPIKVATFNMQNDYGISICCYFTAFDGVVIGFDYISKYEIINDQFMHNASLCGMYPELAQEYGFNSDGSVILNDSETLSMNERLMIEELIRSEEQIAESNTETKQEENKDDFPVKLLDRELLPEAITFNLKDQYGNDISSNDFIGKVLVLNFWTTWCRDCTEEMPGFTNYYNRHKDDADLAILGEVTPNFHKEGTVEDVVTYINENKIPFNNVIDDGGWLYDAYKIHSVPTTMVFDKEGKLVGFTRETLKNAEDFENFVNECLGS